MTLPGGAADKIGNRFEDRWTINILVDVLDEKVEGVRLESPGIDSFEFLVTEGDDIVGHQAKRQTGAGRWTLSQLNRTGVLSNFWQVFQSQEVTRYTFVSTQDAYELGGLAQRARDAASFEEFRQVFLDADKWRESFNDLCRYWAQPNEADAFLALRRIHVETVSENFLLKTILARLEALVDADAFTVASVLSTFIAEHIHQEVTSASLWHFLEEQGFRRRRWGSDPHVLAGVRAQNERYLRAFRREAIEAFELPRSEIAEVMQLVDSELIHAVLLTGEAGAGKSYVTGRIVEALQSIGTPHLAFRVDRLSPVQTANAVGEQLELPGSPTTVLAAIAQGQPSVLIIDQLDAVSLASGRSAEFYDCIEEIITEASRIYQNIKVILVCRSFDVENDHRIKKLSKQSPTTQQVKVQLLTENAVREAVTLLDLDAQRLSTSQIRLLQLPFHLKLLADLVQDDASEPLSFTTANDLFRAFWQQKQQVLQMRLDRQVAWTGIIDKLCDYMSERQVLSVPRNQLDEYELDASAMVSEHVLTFDGQRYAFFHESFFDYAFARRFSSRQELIPFLVGDSQHLFRRAQVRQIFTYRRDEDFDQYLQDLDALLNHAEIRFHLKQLVFSLLAVVNNPTEVEWRILEPFVNTSNSPLGREAQRSVMSVQWFDLLDRLGLVGGWLESGDEFKDLALRMLTGIVQVHPERTAFLLQPYVSAGDEWQQRLIPTLRFGALNSPETLSLFLNFIDAGGVDEGGFWEIVYRPGQQDYAKVCKAIGSYFERGVARSLKNGHPNPFDAEHRTLTESQIASKVLEACAKEAPEAFVDAVLYVVLILLMSNKKYLDSGIWRDEIWTYSFWRTGHGLSGALLKALETALKTLAETAPETVRPCLNLLRTSPYVITQKLLCAAYIAGGAVFADEAFDYLIEKPSRLETERNGKFAWGARDLISAIEPSLSDDQYTVLEEVILSHYADWEYRYPEHVGGTDYPATQLGQTQLVLLDGLSTTKLSGKAAKRLGEWRRKFGYEHSDLRRPRPIGGMAQFVGSPISANHAVHMTDEQWLSAIARYSSEETHWDFDDNTPIGNARQLAFVLERLAQQDPTRFLSMLEQFPDDAHEAYFSSALSGLTKSSASVETVMAAIERCYRLPGNPVARQICWSFQEVAKHETPVRAWEITSDLATQHPDPTHDSGAHLNDRDPDGGLFTQGLNSVRGSAARVIAEMIFDNSGAATYFRPVLSQLVNDPSISVRSCAAYALVHLLRHDRDEAVNLFLKLVDTEDERLLSSHFVVSFLHYALPTHLEQLAPVVTRMLASANESVARAGARQGCLIELSQVESEYGWTEHCLSGAEALRAGAAEVFAANVAAAQHHELCQANLISLFYDENPYVRKDAAGCFSTVGGEMIGEYQDLISSFIGSPTFPEESNELFFALDEAEQAIPEITCVVCEAWLHDTSLLETNDQGWFVGASSIENLVIRTYNQSMQGVDSELQTRSLDLIDKLLESGSFHHQHVLNEFER